MQAWVSSLEELVFIGFKKISGLFRLEELFLENPVKMELIKEMVVC